jgi:hypothetical protein
VEGRQEPARQVVVDVGPGRLRSVAGPAVLAQAAVREEAVVPDPDPDPGAGCRVARADTLFRALELQEVVLRAVVSPLIGGQAGPEHPIAGRAEVDHPVGDQTAVPRARRDREPDPRGENRPGAPAGRGQGDANRAEMVRVVGPRRSATQKVGRSAKAAHGLRRGP